MSQSTLERPATEPAPVAKPRRRLKGGTALYIYTWLVIIWLIIPIFVMIAFSFNDTPGRYNQHWDGFTLKWWHPAKLFEITDQGRETAQKATEALNEFAFGMRPLPDAELEHLSRILRDVRIAEGDFEDMR